MCPFLLKFFLHIQLEEDHAEDPEGKVLFSVFPLEPITVRLQHLCDTEDTVIYGHVQ